MAIYAQQYFNTPHPPVPRKYSNYLTHANNSLYQAAAHPSKSTPLDIPDNSSAPALPTEYYKALGSIPEDLFNSAQTVNGDGGNLDPRWQVMDGPPLPSSPPDMNPSSCVYTTSSMIGITSPSYYTLSPTMATMCLCDSSVFVGINTVTDTSSTSYLVCAVQSSITVSTLQPAAGATMSPPSTSTSSSPPSSTKHKVY